MVWKKDMLKPTQPYFVFDTKDFYQDIYLQQGISHFYTFRLDEDVPLRTVPDGCIDLFFEYGNFGMQGFACGTRLKFTCEECKGGKEVFGIRFMPGVQPELLNATMKDMLCSNIFLKDILKGDDKWLSKLEAEQDFYQRIRIFIENYTRIEKTKIKPFGKKEIIQFVKEMVYKSDGKIKVSQMKENTGYTERYLNKIFIDEMGFSPKVFCQIIRFQRALEFLNYGTPDNMTDAAIYLGYYDQPYFIREFSKYAGITPKKYLKLVQEKQYQQKIKETNFL